MTITIQEPNLITSWPKTVSRPNPPVSPAAARGNPSATAPRPARWERSPWLSPLGRPAERKPFQTGPTGME